MYSFYGGRPGAPFVIVKSFPSVDAMKTAFKDGSSYTEVHYDEYVIINTENKNDPTNGNIYRRGYDFNNNMSGAEYIGTIVGPSGNSPHLEMTTYNDVITKTNQEGASAHSGTGSYAPTTNLIAGKDQNGNFNDTIQWAYCSVRDIDNNDTTAYIGFKIPYPVIEFETSMVSPYNQDKTINDNHNISINRADDTTHPFYEKWHINIPKGIKGDSIKGLKVITANSNDGVTTTDDYDSEQHANDIGKKILVYEKNNYDDNRDGNTTTYYLGDYNMIDDINIDDNGTITFSYTHNSPQTFSNKLKWIDGITYNENGTFTFSYNNGSNSSVFSNILKSINTISVSEDGTLTITYNNGSNSSVFDKTIKWITNVKLEENGILTIFYNDGTSTTANLEETQDQIQGQTQTEIHPIEWIHSLYFDPPTGQILVSYNTSIDNGQRFYTALVDQEGNPANIKMIQSLELEDGFLKAYYNTNNIDENTNEKEATIINENSPIKYIEDIQINETDGTFTIIYNTKHNETEYEYEEDGQTISGQTIIKINDYDIYSLSHPTGIVIDETQKMKVLWDSPDGNGNQKTEYISEPINYITNVKVDGTGRLLMRFSDPARNGTISDIDPISNERYSDWKYMGTISNTNVTFEDPTSNISNKYLTGVLFNQNLMFSLETSQLLSNLIETINIDSCSIQIYNKNNGQFITTFIISSQEPNDNQIEYNIQTSLFGINFIINDISDSGLSTENQLPVDILIENMDLSFTYGDPPASASTDFEQQLQNLTTQVSTINNDLYDTINTDGNTVSGLKTTVEANKSNIDDINDRIGNIAMSVANTGGETITKSLNNLKQQTNKIGTETLNALTHGGTTITSALAALKKPAKNIVSTYSGDGTQGMFMYKSSTVTQAIHLSGAKRIINQEHGYVLQFSRYNEGPVSQYFFWYYIPKDFINAVGNGKKKSFTVPIFSLIGNSLKTLYIEDNNSANQTIISGHEKNNQSVTVGGIQYDNRLFVLSGIYGV